MVHLQRFHEAHSKEGLLVFAISMLPDLEEAKELTSDLGLTYPIFQGSESELGALYAYG